MGFGKFFDQNRLSIGIDEVVTQLRTPTLGRCSIITPGIYGDFLRLRVQDAISMH